MGYLPSEWQSDRLKDVALINSSSLSANTDPDYEFDYLEISNVDYHGVVDANAIERLRFEDAPSRARRCVGRNNIVISSVRPNLQAVAFMTEERDDFVCSTGFNVIDPLGHKLRSKFAYYVIISESGRQYFEATAKGVGYPSIDDKDFGSFSIPLPPLSEQDRIASYLDASCAAIDAAIAAKRKQLETLEAIRKTTIQWALTNGLQRGVKLCETGSIVLDRIPVGWKIVRLKSIASIRYGLGQPPPEKKDGIPIIRATNIDAGKIVKEDELLYIDSNELPFDRQSFLKENEIIVVRSGAYTADSAIIPAKYAGSVAGYDMVVTVTKAVPKFISYCLLSSYILEGQMLLLTLRAAQPHLNADELGGVQIALPPKVEQDAICEYLDNKLDELKNITSCIESQISTLTAYRKSLIHECVTGQRRISEADLARLAPNV